MCLAAHAEKNTFQIIIAILVLLIDSHSCRIQGPDFNSGCCWLVFPWDGHDLRHNIQHGIRMLPITCSSSFLCEIISMQWLYFVKTETQQNSVAKFESVTLQLCDFHLWDVTQLTCNVRFSVVPVTNDASKFDQSQTASTELIILFAHLWNMFVFSSLCGGFTHNFSFLGFLCRYKSPFSSFRRFCCCSLLFTLTDSQLPQNQNIGMKIFISLCWFFSCHCFLSIPWHSQEEVEGCWNNASKACHSTDSIVIFMSLYLFAGQQLITGFDSGRPFSISKQTKNNISNQKCLSKKLYCLTPSFQLLPFRGRRGTINKCDYFYIRAPKHVCCDSKLCSLICRYSHIFWMPGKVRDFNFYFEGCVFIVSFVN